MYGYPGTVPYCTQKYELEPDTVYYRTCSTREFEFFIFQVFWFFSLSRSLVVLLIILISGLRTVREVLNASNLNYASLSTEREERS